MTFTLVTMYPYVVRNLSREEEWGIQEERRGHSDCRSRGLSYHSIGTDAEGLDWVRDGTG